MRRGLVLRSGHPVFPHADTSEHLDDVGPVENVLQLQIYLLLERDALKSLRYIDWAGIVGSRAGLISQLRQDGVRPDMGVHSSSRIPRAALSGLSSFRPGCASVSALQH